MDTVGPAQSADPLAIVRAAQDELEQAIQLGGLARDPMRHPLRALSATLGAIQNLHRTGVEHHHEVRAALAEEARTTIERATAEMRAAEATTIERISLAIATSAEQALGRRVRIFDRNSALAAAAALFLVTAAALGTGFAWGQNAARAAHLETEAQLGAAFRDGPDAARSWVGLMEANDPRQVIVGCAGGDIWSAPDGRRACRAALWLDPPKRNGPKPGNVPAQAGPPR